MVTVNIIMIVLKIKSEAAMIILNDDDDSVNADDNQ